jgi:hypothetical protein
VQIEPSRSRPHHDWCLELPRSAIKVAPTSGGDKGMAVEIGAALFWVESLGRKSGPVYHVPGPREINLWYRGATRLGAGDRQQFSAISTANHQVDRTRQRGHSRFP